MSARAALLVAFVAALLALAVANRRDEAEDEKLLADARRTLDGDGPPADARPAADDPDADADADADPVRNPAPRSRKRARDVVDDDDKGNADGDGGGGGGDNNADIKSKDNVNGDGDGDDRRAADANVDDRDNDSDADANRNHPPKTMHEPPRHSEHGATDGMPADAATRFKHLLEEAAKLAPNALAAGKLHDAASHAAAGPPGVPLAEVAKLKRELAAAHREATAARQHAETTRDTLRRERKSFERSLQAARADSRAEQDEMRAAMKEQKHAFDELFEEKRFMAHMLQQEQAALRVLQDRIQHPDLAQWIRQRAARAAILMESPETGAVKYYARKFMAPKVDKMRHRIETLERRVERTIDHLLPARYGYFVAVLLSIGLIAFPVFVSVSTIVSISKQMSLRQYVLLGNVFLSAFAIALCVAGLLLRQDPLQTLYEAGESLFILLQLLAAVVFPFFLAVLLGAVARSRDRLDMFVFGCEFVFYLLVGLNYRTRVWRPAMLGQHIETSPMMYFVYLMDFVSMTALTVSSSRMDPAVMLAWREVESGVAGTYAAATGFAAGATKPSVHAPVGGAAVPAGIPTPDDVEVGMHAGTQQRSTSNGHVASAGAAHGGVGGGPARGTHGRSNSGGALAKLSNGVLQRVGSGLQMHDVSGKDE